MKKFSLKSVVAGIIAGVIITCGVGVAATAVVNGVYFSQYPIYVNGSYYSPRDPALNYNGRTYLPLNELGTLLGGDITFNNNTIYVDTDGIGSGEKDIKIEKGDSEKYYVSLARYGAKSATISGDNSYVKVSKTKVTSSGDIKLTGSKVGKATIKIKYSTGDVEKLNVKVVDEYDDDEDDEELEVGDTYKTYIDLDDYDADKATITYDSDYVSVSKTTFTSNGYLTITAKKEGSTKVKVKYDTGDVDYIYLDIEDDDEDEEEDEDLNYDEIEVEEGDSEYLYVDLDEYNAKSATLTYNDSYIKLDKTTLTSNGKVKVTGKNEGYTSIKIKFNTGKIIPVLICL